MQQWRGLRPNQCQLRGVLGATADLSLEKRLRTFITDEESEPLQLFMPSYAGQNHSGDWYGEHVGKWLVAASRAADRAQDDRLLTTVRRVADALLSVQEPSGYIGTYAPTARARIESGSSHDVRSWDIWVMSTTVLGLLETYRATNDEQYVSAAAKVIDFVRTHTIGQPKGIAYMGNHSGLSAAAILEPIVDLYDLTGDDATLAFAEDVLEQFEVRGDLRLMSKCLCGEDVATIGTGKIYQIGLALVGMTKLYRANGDRQVLTAVLNAWRSICDDHLTPMGGPWGGIAAHKEVFNPKGFFSPQGMVETCSTMAWMQLNRELLFITGEARFAEEFEKSAYNGVLGAIDENGEDWSYFTFPNGKRNSTYYWACCKSSGATALEEVAPVVFTESAMGIALNLFVESHICTPNTDVALSTGKNGSNWTLDATRLSGALSIRIPTWAQSMIVTMDGKVLEGTDQSGYRNVGSVPNGSQIVIELVVQPRITAKSATVEHHGQEIVRSDYFSVNWGPFVLATGLLDGYKRAETLRLPTIATESHFHVGEPQGASWCPSLKLQLPGRAPIAFDPYFEAGGRTDGKWRAVWQEVAWQ